MKRILAIAALSLFGACVAGPNDPAPTDDPAEQSTADTPNPDLLPSAFTACTTNGALRWHATASCCATSIPSERYRQQKCVNHVWTNTNNYQCSGACFL